MKCPFFLYGKCINGVSEYDPVDIIERFHKVNFEPLFQVVGQGFKVLAIVMREDERLQARSSRGNGLFLEASDWQNAAGQCQLTCHAELLFHQFAGDCRHQGGRHGNACRWAVFRGGSGRDMQVDEKSPGHRRNH